MANALKKAKLLAPGATVESVREVLQEKVWTDHVAIVWGIDDVTEQAKHSKVRLTKEQKRAVLQRILNKHDATQGVTWDTIDAAIDDVKAR